ncbi:MAG: YeeE/YedE thiosulfate transporter family protein [Armatimonadota bacterium]|nr:YeeE/YedE thiosulfate transporter family protein [Armatimonadota bacterium]MDW8107587.1 YeeE/YedE thiosulfate transporter family protein [Armatimonadota bacterium]MDW8107590.1 YeeE/YedE thiosulfate transporter family protein [Armatimonadota bacterium]
METTHILGLVTGIIFGFALHRAGFSRCGIVMRGLAFRDFTMLKVMLTAITVGMLGAATLATFAPDYAHLKVKSLYVWGVLVGGLIFGVGMAVAGFCPGTALVGLGSGTRDGLLAVLGGLTGAFAFILAYPRLEPVLVEPLNLGKLTLHEVLGLPYLLTALLVAAALVGILVWLNRLEAKAAKRPLP